MDLGYRMESGEIELSAQPDGAGWRVRMPDGSERRFEAERLDGDVLRIRLDDRVFEAPFALKGKNVLISFDGVAYEFSPAGSAAAKSGVADARSGSIIAPMVGTLTQLLVQEGESVGAYQPLAVIEAMKVLVTLEAPFAGVVRNLSANKGDRVEHGATIMEIAAPCDQAMRQRPPEPTAGKFA